jgi:hypothetical protein
MSERTTAVKQAIYQHVADHASMPTVQQVASVLRETRTEVLAAYAELAAKRMLVLEPDGETIRMASPFSGVETQHQVEANCKIYQANCAWDGFGVAATLGVDATVRSRCEQSGEPLSIRVTNGMPTSLQRFPEWRFHTPVAASHWWNDIVFT